MEGALVQHRNEAERTAAGFTATEAVMTVNYEDGGMHPTSHEILRQFGLKNLQGLTPGSLQVSRPEAALPPLTRPHPLSSENEGSRLCHYPWVVTAPGLCA